MQLSGYGLGYGFGLTWFSGYGFGFPVKAKVDLCNFFGEKNII